jgi:hypothetical protein
MKSELGTRLAEATPADARATGEGGGFGAKFPRCLVSEIVAVDVPVEDRSNRVEGTVAEDGIVDSVWRVERRDFGNAHKPRASKIDAHVGIVITPWRRRREPALPRAGWLGSAHCRPARTTPLGR